MNIKIEYVKDGINKMMDVGSHEEGEKIAEEFGLIEGDAETEGTYRFTE